MFSPFCADIPELVTLWNSSRQTSLLSLSLTFTCFCRHSWAGQGLQREDCRHRPDHSSGGTNQNVRSKDEWTIKTPNPICRLFFKNYLLICGIVFNRFYRQELHSLIGWCFRSSLWTVAPMDEGTRLVYCCPSIFSLTSPPSPLPKLNVQYI